MFKRHLRLFTLAFILTLVLMLPLFIYLSVDAQGPDETQTYVASDGSFSLQYPEDWHLIEEGGIIMVSNVETSFLSEGEIEDDTVVILIIPPDELQSFMGIDSVGSPTQVMERYLKSFSGGNIATFGDPEGIILGETVAVRVYASDYETEGWVYMIDAGNDTVMMVGAVAALNDFEQHEQSVLTTLNSLSFSDIAVSEASDSAPPTPRIIVVTSTPIPTEIQSSLSQMALTATALILTLDSVPTQMPFPPTVELFLPTQGIPFLQPTATSGLNPTISPEEFLATMNATQTFADQATSPPTLELFTATSIQPELNSSDYQETITALESTIAAWEASATTMAGGAPPSNPDDCLIYAVQAGDTLSSIATVFGVLLEDLITLNALDDNPILQIGQELLIPSENCQLAPSIPTPTLGPTAIRTPLPTAFGTLSLEIVAIEGVGDITIESVEIRNIGNTIEVTGWTLEDEDGNVYEFPEMRLFANASVRIFSRAGQNTPVALYWNANDAIWQDGEIATLFDADGNVVTAYIVGED